MSGATSQHRRPTALTDTARDPIRDYKHVADLGRFGMIDRWVASRHTAAGPTLHTISELRHECARRAEGRQWFLRRCRAQARLRHPNWVAYEDFGEHRGRFFFATEYLEGQPLTALGRRSVLPRGEGLYVMRQAIEGLAYLHGLSHQNDAPVELAYGRFGPSSVFVGYDGTVKLSDVGEPPPGEPRSEFDVTYAPPEAVLGQRVDRRSDVFVAGILLWETVAGRALWQDLPEATVSRRLELGVIPDLRCFVPGAQSDICRIVERAMASAPDSRYQDAGELSRALVDCLDGFERAGSESSLSALVSEAFAGDRARMRELIGGRRKRGSGARPLPTADAKRRDAVETEPPHTSHSVPVRTPKTSGIAPKPSETPTATHELLPSSEGDGTEELLPHPYAPVLVLKRTDRGRVIAIRHSVSGVNLIAKVANRDSGLMGRAVAAAALQHPHTARILDVGATPDGAAVFTIHERVDGVPLSEALAAGKPLAPSVALRIVRQVACSLIEAHQRGIVHGRLRPEHVFLSDCPIGGRYAKVTGYEGEKTREAATAMPKWAPPELLAGAGVPTPASDLFAAGLLLLHCTAGAAGAHGDIPEQTVRRLVEQRHLAFRVRGLSDAIEMAVATDPGRREKSVASWLTALDAIALDPSSTEGPRPPRPRRASAQTHRFALGDRPSIWVLEGDAGTAHESVRAALLKLGTDANVRVISADAEREALTQLEKEKTSPPWVLLFGMQHVKRNSELLTHLSLIGEVSRLLVTVHPTVVELREAIHLAGLDAHVALPDSARSVTARIVRMVERAREVRRRYDEIRYALRDTRSQIRGLTRSLTAR